MKGVIFMGNKITKYVNKENGKKVLKGACIVGLAYVGTVLAIKKTDINIHLFADGKEMAVEWHD